jgi:hypothetical protein
VIGHAWRFLRYQAYGLALVGGGLALAALALARLPWWLGGLAALATLWPLGFGVEVLRRWPRKLRAARVAERRVASGRFRPAQVRSLCGDPCFRVVARDILTGAGVPRRQRRRIIAGYRAELAREQRTAFVVDHARGVVVTIIDGRATETRL